MKLTSALWWRINFAGFLLLAILFASTSLQAQAPQTHARRMNVVSIVVDDLNSDL